MSRRIYPPLVLGALLFISSLFPSLAPSHGVGHAQAASATQTTVSPIWQAAIQANYGRLPLSFEVNQGQADSAVRFLARGSGYMLALTPDEALLALMPGSGAPSQPRALLTGPAATQRAPISVGMRWLGANPDPLVTGEDPLPGKVNYFIGNDPSQWHTNIPTFQQVRLHDVYPGVDLVYYGNQGQLEYDFVVAPGADPAHITLGFSGVNQIGVDLLGNLSLGLPSGAIQQAKPLIYQTVDGARQTIAGGYTLSGARRVGFALGAYNPRLPLVIDPAYHFSTYLGGTGTDQGFGIAVDSQGNAYVAGGTNSTDFPVTFQFEPYNGGSSDAFVSELNSLGTALIYSTYVGGSGYDQANAVTVDTDGSAVFTGQTNSTNYPVTEGAFQMTAPGGGSDAFVTKLTPAGSGFTFSTYLGGTTGNESGNGVALDSAHDVYIAGGTTSTDFPTTGGVFQTSSGGGEDAFVTELLPSGSALDYSTYLGGSGSEQANAIAVDPSYFYAYVTGTTNSTNFPTTTGAVQTSSGGGTDAFVTELSTSGGSLMYSTYLGGSGSDYGRAIALRAVGVALDDAFVAGTTTSSNFPVTTGSFQTVAPGGSGDAFVTALNSDGKSYDYSTYLGGNGDDQAFGITVDSGFHAIVTGSTTSTNFPTVNPLQFTYHGGTTIGDAFVTVLSQGGNAALYNSYLGGAGDDAGYAIARNGADDIFVTGYTDQGGFPTTSGAYDTSYNGNGDAFIAKMQVVPPVVTTTGVFRPSNGTLYLKNSNTTGPADITLAYGLPGDLPVTGDWIGQGFHTIGVYRSGTFYLRNTNTTGPADITVAFGAAGDLPVAGDWTGKGYDSIGVYRPSNNTFYLRNTNTAGPADITVTFGSSGDVPIVGDWTNKGYDSIGIYRPSNGNVYLRNSNTTGFADTVFDYGLASDKPVVGDWDGNGTDTIGVDRAGNFLLRNSNTTGPADLSFFLGVSGDDPIAGPWHGFPLLLAPPHGGSVPTKAAPPSGKSARRP